MKHFVVKFVDEGKEIRIHEGATLLDAANAVDIALNTVCGGAGTCGKCRVVLVDTGQEVAACQTTIDRDMLVRIPAASRLFRPKILSGGVKRDREIESNIWRKYEALAGKGMILGSAVDIGTTTVVLKLIDMRKGTCLATETALNSQSRYGDDVISRISFGSSEEGFRELRKSIAGCIDGLLGKACSEANVSRKDVYEVCCVGNTTMGHVMAGLPIEQLGQSPYKAYELNAVEMSVEEAGIQMNEAGSVRVGENIAGFVGSDTVAVGLAVDIACAAEMTLVVDIGTNGELICGTSENLLSASCAAGPALEGARIKYGSRGVDGAIEAVVINSEDIDIDVIGGGNARSICGSGLVDAIAVMLELGVIDMTGRFISAEDAKSRLSEKIAARVIEEEGGAGFVLSWQSQGQPKVILTQKDVREMQLAKAAIRTGIELLLKRLGISACQVDRVLMAGAFGNYIRAQSALRVGLLPKVELSKIHFVGNAASSGAEMMLLSDAGRQEAGDIARQVNYVEIANEPAFGNIYAECMLFE
jgi:uncharacterized 2Fe-2S/4Fe-4S cluster protein (DUF4445 family)